MLSLPLVPFAPAPVSGIHDTSQDICQPLPESSPSLAPCIRLPNGSLVPNPDSQFCRYFKTYSNPNDTQCPTICPDSCVELWETCASGTGQLTSVVHTKTATDGIIQQMVGNPTPGVLYKDYRECYAFGTKFCTFPETKLTRLADGTTVCFKDCPPGTYADDDMCYVSDPTVSGPVGNPLFCNPQYFTSVFSGGTFLGCKKIPLGVKDTESCPAGFEPIVNEQFTTEWCQPQCPTGFFPSLNLDFCFASCNRDNAFQDYVDYYIKSGRCGGSPEGECPANALGQCPTTTSTSVESSYTQTYANVVVLVPPAMPTTVFGSSSIPSKTRTGQPTQKVAQPDNPETIINCYPGMVTALPNTGETAGFCYDECPESFVSAEICANTGAVFLSGTPTCDPSQVRFVCLAQCPVGFDPVTVDATTQKMLTCAFRYPNNKVPTDPSLFVQCPSDGTSTSITLPDPTLPSGQSAPQRPPVCLRRIFERNQACPENFYLLPAFKGPPALPARCVQNCPKNSTPVFRDGSVVCTEQCPQDGRFTQNFTSLYNTGSTLSNYKNSNCIRKSFGVGTGSDPLFLTTNQSNVLTDTRNTSISAAAVVFGILAFVFVFKKVLNK